LIIILNNDSLRIQSVFSFNISRFTKNNMKTVSKQQIRNKKGEQKYNKQKEKKAISVDCMKKNTNCVKEILFIFIYL
jgi:hypothetical protein